jgi:RimJ/RimL family protein N-acetyltransferase
MTLALPKTLLIEASDDDFAALIAGEAPPNLRLADSAIAPTEVLVMLRDVASKVRAQFSPAAWMMVEGGAIVGLCSITKLPLERRIDIGYGVAPTHYGQGIASRAVAAILDFAAGDSRVNRVTAETAIDNIASQIVLERNGFARVGSRDDPEDGRLICWAAECAPEQFDSSEMGTKAER